VSFELFVASLYEEVKQCVALGSSARVRPLFIPLFCTFTHFTALFECIPDEDHLRPIMRAICLIHESTCHPATMRFSLPVVVVLTACCASSVALQITSPTSGSTIDPTQSLTISWSISYTDPSTIDLKLSQSGSSDEITLATGAVTYAGSYTVPAGTLKGSGSGYTIVAIGNGNTLNQISGLSLGAGGSNSGNQQTSTVAQVTMTSTQTVIPTPAAVTSVGTEATSGTIPTASSESVGFTTMSGTVSGSEVSSSISHSGSSFVTSKASRTSSSSSTAKATAGSTNTANGQRRPGSELVLGAAGVLAGIVALLA